MSDWLCPICRQGFSDAQDFIRHLDEESQEKAKE